MEKMTDNTKVGVNGFCYEYRGHNILISANIGYLHGDIQYNGKTIASGFCGYGLKTAVERINRRIDKELNEAQQ